MNPEEELLEAAIEFVTGNIDRSQVIAYVVEYGEYALDQEKVRLADAESDD